MAVALLGFAGDSPRVGPCSHVDSETIDCVVGALESGFRVSGFVVISTTAAGPLTVTAKATPTVPDANPADNSATVRIVGGG